MGEDKQDKILQELGAIRLQVSLHESSVKELYDRTTKLERFMDRSDEVTRNIKASIDEMKLTINNSLDKFSEQIKELQFEPAKDWKSLRATIISVIVTTLVTGALGVFAYVLKK